MQGKRGYGKARETFRSRSEGVAHSPQESSRPAQSARKPWTDDSAPAGYDQEIWDICRRFRDLAEKDDIFLRQGLPVIYHDISRTLRWFDAEGGTRAFDKHGDGTVEWTYRQVYRDADNKRVKWNMVVEAAVDEFWTRIWDDGALRYFCDFEVFEEMMHRVCERWQNARMKARAAARCDPDPQPMVWNRDESKRIRRTRG